MAASRFNRPRRWRVSPPQVPAPFGGMWRGLDMFLPIWDEGGDPRDVAPTLGARSRVLTLGSTPYGAAPGARGVAVPDTVEVATSSAASDHPADRSVMCVVTLASLPGSGRTHLWGMRSGGAFLTVLGVTPTGAPDFYEVTGGAVTVTGDAGLMTVGKRHCLVGVSDSGVGMFLYLDGRLVASNTAGPPTFLALFGLAGYANAVTGTHGTRCNYALQTGAFWTRALTHGEATALSADPFGLVRPRRRARWGEGEVVAPAAGLRAFAQVI